MPNRPPKKWWDKCVASTKSKTKSPEQLCGWVWHHEMSDEAKAKAMRGESTFDLGSSDVDRALLEMHGDLPPKPSG